MPKKRKSSQTKEIIIAFLAVTILALSIQFLFLPDFNNISAQQDEDKNFRDTETGQVIPREEIDFPSTEEGTFSGWLKKSYFKEPVDKEVVLFSSARIPGLTLIYHSEENRLSGGIPAMAAENILFFDKQRHHLVYTFKKGGWQYLYYDGQQVAASEFQPSLSKITGLITGTSSQAISESFEQIEIS